jgi:hypothetical protein
MDRDELTDHVAHAITRARGAETTTDWDRAAAKIAIRRWQSFGRRHLHADSYESRVADLARGLLERLDPQRMDEPGWHTAAAAATVLRERTSHS